MPNSVVPNFRLTIGCILSSAVLSACTATLCGAPAADSGDQASVKQAAPPNEAKPEEKTPAQWIDLLKEERLSPEQITTATELALRAQADDKVAWDKKWGDFVQMSHEKGKLSDELWGKYLAGAVRFTIRVVSEAKRGEGLLIRVEQDFARTGGPEPAAQAIGVLMDDLSGIATRTQSEMRNDWMNLSSISARGAGRKVDLMQERFAALQPGPQTYHYRYLIQIVEKSTEKGKPGKLLGKRTVEGVLSWKLLPDDAAVSPPTLKADASLMEAVRNSLHVEYVLRDEDDTSLVQTMIQVDDPPTGMGFDVSLRFGKDSLPLGPAAWKKGKVGMGWWSYDAELPSGVDNVDVVLVPSAKAAATLASKDSFRLMNLDIIWDGPEIVIPGVRVRSQKLGMPHLSRPSKKTGFAYALSQLDASGPAAAEMRRSGDTAAARSLLTYKIKLSPKDGQAHFELACVLVADDDYGGAMAEFVAARQLSETNLNLRGKIHHEQRRLCAIWIQEAEKKRDVSAMAALGAAYEMGWGVAANLEDAKRWYENAARLDHEESKAWLKAHALKR